MFPRIGLRLRIFLLFAAFGLVTGGIVVGAVVLGLGEAVKVEPERAGGVLLVFAGGAVLLVLALVFALWIMFDANLAAPVQSLLGHLHAHTGSHPYHSAPFDHGEPLSHLPDAVREISQHLTIARDHTTKSVARAVARMDEQKSRLDALLRDLREGVVICDLGHQVQMFNQRARIILDADDNLEPGGSLFTLLAREPVIHALERLTNPLGEERGADGEPMPPRIAPFVCATTDGRTVVEAQMSLSIEPDGRAGGYVLTVDDVTEELVSLGRRDRLLRQAVEDLRRPVASLRAAVETLIGSPGMSNGDRAAFEDVVVRECQDMGARLEGITAEYRDIITGYWPMTDLYSANLLGCVARRFEERGDTTALMTGVPAWFHGDSHSLSELLEYLVHRLREQTGVAAFDLEARPGPRHIYVDVAWKGEAVPAAVLESWLDAPLERGLGGLSVRDVLEHHRADLWSMAGGDGRARLRLPLPPAIAPRPRPVDLPPRPDFFDLDPPPRSALEPSLAERSLRSLTYAVFDTETTGLQPSGGDEIISIAAVRIVDGRILTGESFSQLVNPRRGIPKGSIRFHGITDRMVKGRPSIREALPRFREFVDGAVLVGHNAAFDMKFLRLKEELCGVRIDNVVLDTLLLSVVLDGEGSEHHLDAVARRFGLDLAGRHTALGDALLTAALFLAMLERLEASGIWTLAQALDRCERVVRVRGEHARF